LHYGPGPLVCNFASLVEPDIDAYAFLKAKLTCAAAYTITVNATTLGINPAEHLLCSIFPAAVHLIY
jgi:hypothetical protein